MKDDSKHGLSVTSKLKRRLNIQFLVAMQIYVLAICKYIRKLSKIFFVSLSKDVEHFLLKSYADS